MMAEGLPEFSKLGRFYDRWRALQVDLKRKIIQDIVEDGGDFVTGFFPGSFSVIAKRNRVKYDTVRKFWKDLVHNRNAGITERHTAGVKHLQQDDADFIRFLKTDRASMTIVDPYKLKFFDESGIKLPDVGRPNYGHSLCGTPAVEIVRYSNSPNVTLNLMCGLDGIVYASTVDGNSNSFSFLSFFEEASSVYLPDGKPAYSYGDHVIIDNTPIHHHQAGQALGEWLDEIGCTAVYLPTYPPKFNPAENVFNKLKTILRRFEYRELLKDSLHVAVHEALKEITSQDMRGFFASCLLLFLTLAL
ncbi:hypothetical protein ACROYT_G015206 [Oculina patagonica]